MKKLIKKNNWLKGVSLILLSLVMLAIGFWIAGVDRVLYDLKQFPVWVVLGVAIVFAANLFLVAFRLNQLLKYSRVVVPYNIALKASLQGNFASLFLISLFGQVAGRQIVLRHYGLPSILVASLTAIERVMIFLVSGGFCLVGSAWLLDKLELAAFFEKISFVQIIFVVIFGFALSMFFGRTTFEIKLLNRIRTKRSFRHIFQVLTITIVAQLLILSSFVIGGLALAPGISFVSLLAAAAITSFAASLPISVNGWGVREVAAVFAFGQIGIPPSSALAISILVGLCSTAVVLVAVPYLLSRQQAQSKIEEATASVSGSDDYLPMEKVAAWSLTTACVILIFFQIQVPLQNGLININLADAIAILALASVVSQCVLSRTLPKWSIPKFNLLLGIAGLMIFFAFLNGVRTIGVTQWAFAGRLLGWLVLLGYLSIGVLAISYVGSGGIRRLIETMAATAIAIIFVQIVMRWITTSGWIDFGSMTLQFEGYSANRNAFAFQLLTCIALLIAYSKNYVNRPIVETKYLGSDNRLKNVLALALGVLMVGVVFSASRAGLLACAALLITAYILNFVQRPILVRSVLSCCVIWVVCLWALPIVSQILNKLLFGVGFLEGGNSLATIQTPLSHPGSNIERWDTIVHGIEMWRESPWLGAGLGAFISTSLQWSARPIVIHSTPLWILAEFGLLGAVVFGGIFLWLIICLGRSGFSRYQNRATLMLLGVFMMFGLVHEIFYQRIFWLGLGLCISKPFDRAISLRGPQ